MRIVLVRQNLRGGIGMNGGDRGEKSYERNFWKGRVEMREVREDGYA